MMLLHVPRIGRAGLGQPRRNFESGYVLKALASNKNGVWRETTLVLSRTRRNDRYPDTHTLSKLHRRQTLKWHSGLLVIEVWIVFLICQEEAGPRSS